MARNELQAIDLACAISEDAACKGRAAYWAQLEKNFRMVSEPEAVAMVRDEIRSICASCPLADQHTCKEWAVADEYSGWAAGMLWRKGRPIEHPSRRFGSHERAAQRPTKKRPRKRAA